MVAGFGVSGLGHFGFRGLGVGVLVWGLGLRLRF